VAADPRIAAAVDHARRNLHLPLRLSDLANAARLSPARLSRYFAAAMGLPPLRWVEEQRMAHAAMLLQADSTPVAEIAARVGFSDAFYFSRRFRAWSGRSPRAWRAQITPG
jgi:AraC family transcriptional regulator of arabinose operon